MADDTRCPHPLEDADNRAMLEAWREEGRLVVQRCVECARAASYPRPLCPYCWSERLAFEAASGRGRIVAWSRVHRPNHESFFAEAPIVLAEIALREGASVIARVVCAPDAVRSGAEVELVAEPERYPLPTFRLKGGTP